MTCFTASICEQIGDYGKHLNADPRDEPFFGGAEMEHPVGRLQESDRIGERSSS